MRAYLCVTRLHSATHTSATDHKFGICLRACNINNNVVVVAAVSRCTKHTVAQWRNITVYLVELGFAFHCEHLNEIEREKKNYTSKNQQHTNQNNRHLLLLPLIPVCCTLITIPFVWSSTSRCYIFLVYFCFVFAWFSYCLYIIYFFRRCSLSRKCATVERGWCQFYIEHHSVHTSQ